MTMTATTTHYHAMNGEHGCLPDNNSVYLTRRHAVEGLTTLFELSRRRAADLRKSGYLELRPADGAAYCEIVECTDAECLTEEDLY